MTGSPHLLTLGLLAAIASVMPATQLPAQNIAKTTPCAPPTSAADGWTIASASSANLDETRLCNIGAKLKALNINVHGLVVARHGKLVFEQYLAGHDMPWGMPAGRSDFDATTSHDMRSVSKSVTSLLVGIAIARGLIAGVDEPVMKLLPAYADAQGAGWNAVTIRHLLTMSSGMRWDENLPWNDPRNDEPHLGTESDPIRYVLAKPITSPPDTLWTYNGGGTDLLAAIVAKASGKPFDAFAREALFEPLGMTGWEWKTYRNGSVSAAAGLRLRPRDAAKIGQLVLNKGRWNDRQLVPADWIERSIEPRFQAIGYFGSLYYYGYQWWMGRSLVAGREFKWTAAVGLGGQRVFIVPDMDMVVAITAGLYASPLQGNVPVWMLGEVIAAASESSRP